MREELQRQTNALIEQYLKKGYTSVSYAVWIDGEIVVNDSFGTTGGLHPEKATTDSTYNVASLSKIYTTAAVMKCVDMGRLDLDTPVITYLPELKFINEGADRITLRQCLSHSCALPGTQWIDFSVSDQKDVDFYKDALDYFSNSYLKAEPGKFSVYCNDGFTLAEMCVARVSDEQSFSEFTRVHITDPLGAFSSRFAGSNHPDYTMVAQGKAPKELVTAQGLGGLTTSMKDLTLFASQFLPNYGGNPVHILSEASIKEIVTPQGKTFLKKDTSSPTYGLGWDNVNYTLPGYDLGEGTLRKGGASFQFGSNLMVIPKYNAVVCMSETYDCGLNTRDLSLKILALCLMEVKGINMTRHKPVTDSFRKQWEGDYADNNGLIHISFFGTRCYLIRESTDGKKSEMFEFGMANTGRGFVSKDGHKLVFEQANGGRYALIEYDGLCAPLAQKLKKAPKLGKTWENRLDKKYVIINLKWYDENIVDMNAGFAIRKLGENPGYMAVSFSGGSEGVTDVPIRPLTAQRATGFLDAPDNASRDQVTTLFFKEKGAEYCITNSYLYKEAASLSVYRGEEAALSEILAETEKTEKADRSFAFRIEKETPLQSMKLLSKEYRCLVLNEALNTVTDTLMNPVNEETGEPEGFREMKSGYLLMTKKTVKA